MQTRGRIFREKFNETFGSDVTNGTGGEVLSQMCDVIAGQHVETADGRYAFKFLEMFNAHFGVNISSQGHYWDVLGKMLEVMNHEQ